MSTGRSLRREYAGIWLLTAVFLAFYTVYSISRYTTFLAAGYDLGIFDQAVRAYAHVQAPIVPLKGPTYNVLGDHFSPIIATIAPLYWLWDNACVLLLVQSLLIAASIPIVFRFTRRRAGFGVSLVLAAAYGAGWALQAMIDFDFHEIAFALPLLALAVDALDRGRDRTLLICAALLLLVREDMGIVLVILGILRLTSGATRHPQSPRRVTDSQDQRRENLRHSTHGSVTQREVADQPRASRPSGLSRLRWYPRAPVWPGVALIAAGLIGYVLATNVLIPAFAPNGKFNYWQYDALGSNLPAALGNIVIRPWHAAKLFFSPWEKTQSLLYLLVPLAFLPLRSRYALLALPLLGERYFNSRSLLWSTHYHYSALPWLVFVLAAADGGARLGVFTHRLPRTALVAWLVIVPVWITAVDTVTPAALRRTLTGAAWAQNSHTAARQAVTARIPSNVCVAVDDRLAPHLARRDYVTLADGQLGRADFVALDMSASTIGGNDGPPPASVRAKVDALRYRVVFTDGPIVLLQSPHYVGPSSECRPTGPGKSG